MTQGHKNFPERKNVDVTKIKYGGAPTIYTTAVENQP